jgi:hypothetical protein
MPWPEDSGGPPHPHPFGCLVLASGSLRPSPSATSLSRSCTSSSGIAVSPTAYRILCLRFACLVRLSLCSATDARLDTGGWLALTRQGLSPCKIRQAFLGAIRGRDASYPAPPAQTRTCSIPASGSSVALASAQAKPVTGPPPVCCSPQGGWLILVRPDMSGMSFLCGLRAPVRSFPM